MRIDPVPAVREWPEVRGTMSEVKATIDAEALLENAGWMRALARRLLRDEGAAEDAVQDTFLAALERPPRSRRGLRAWLAAVLRHIALNRRRDEGRRLFREYRAARQEALPSASELVEEAALQRELVRLLIQLEDPYRSLILLRFFKGLAPREIARGRGVPAPTVRSQISRGVALLRERLEADRTAGRRDWRGTLLSLAAPPAATKVNLAVLAASGLLLAGAAVGTLTFTRAPAPSGADDPVASQPLSAAAKPAAVRQTARTAVQSTEEREALTPPLGKDSVVSGLVRAPDTNPLAGALVTVADRDGDALRSTITDAAGRFTIDVSPARPSDSGSKARSADTLHFASEGFAARSMRDGWVLRGRGDVSEPLFEPEPGLRCRRGYVEITLGPASRVRGTVLWDDGTPCSGATLRPDHVKDRGTPKGAWWLGPLVPVVTDDAGRFELPALPAATLLEVNLRVGDWTAFEAPYLSTPPAGQTSSVAWNLTRPAELEVILDGWDRLPNGDQQIESRYRVGVSRGGGMRPVQDGRVVFTGLHPDERVDVVLRDRDGKNEALLLEDVPLEAGRTTVHATVPLSLEPVASRRAISDSWQFDLRFVSPHGGPLTTEQLFLEAGIQGSDFALRCSGGHEIWVADSWLSDNLDSPASLRVAVLGEEPAQFTLFLRGATLFSGSATLRAQIDVPVDFRALSSQRVPVRFHARNEANEPLQLGVVTIENIETGRVEQYGCPDRTGIVRCSLPPGRYVFAVTDWLRAPGFGKLTITPGTARDVTVLLPLNRAVEGVVTPLAGADEIRMVQLVSSERPLAGAHGRPSAGTVSPNGSYRFANVTPGEHLLAVLTIDRNHFLSGFYQEPLSVGADEITRHDVQLPSETRGTRFRFDLGPHEKALILARRPDGTPLFACTIRSGSVVTMPEANPLIIGRPPVSDRGRSGYGDPVRGELINEEDGLVRVAFPFQDDG